MHLRNRNVPTPRRRLHSGAGALELRFRAIRGGVSAPECLYGIGAAAAIGARPIDPAQPLWTFDGSRRRHAVGAAAGVLIGMVWAWIEMIVEVPLKQFYAVSQRTVRITHA